MNFKFAINFMFAGLSRTVLSIILAVVGILVIVFTTIIGVGTEYARDSADKLLTSGFEKTAIGRMSDPNMEFIYDLQKQPEIRALGYMSDSYADITGLPELAAIQHAQNGTFGSGLEHITMYSDTLNLCKIEFQEGKVETEYPNYNTEYLYLGANFSEIPVGTVYETEYTTYIVAGIFKKSQRFIDCDFSYGFQYNHSDYTYNCDNSVFAAFPFMFSSDFWLSASENYTLEQAIDKAFEIAEKHEAEISYRTLQKSYEDAMINVLTVKSIFSKLMPIVCVSCVVMILCMQLSDVFSGLRDFGIMYSQGFSRADIEKITITKNLITFFVSIVVSLPLISWLINFWYQAKDGKAVMLSLLFEIALPTALAVILGIIVLSTVISIVVFRKYTPVQMIGGQND